MYLLDRFAYLCNDVEIRVFVWYLDLKISEALLKNLKKNNSISKTFHNFDFLDSDGSISQQCIFYLLCYILLQ